MQISPVILPRSSGSPLTGGSFSAPAERGTRTALACSPLTGGEFFAEPQRGDSPSADGGNVPRPAAGQEGRHQGFYPLNSHFLLGESGADCLYVTASKWGNGSRVTLAFVSQNIRSSQTAYCYTYGLLCAGATYPCRAIR